MLQVKLKWARRRREELLKAQLQLQGNQSVASGGNDKLEDGSTKEELVKNTHRR